MADDTNTETATEDSPYSVTIEDAGPACKALTITIPADRIKEKIEESYATLDNDAVNAWYDNVNITAAGAPLPLAPGERALLVADLAAGPTVAIGLTKRLVNRGLTGEIAEAMEAEAPDTVRFTRAIKDAVPYEDRRSVVQSLWTVVLADGERAQEEDALLRLVANLLGVSDVDSAMARQRAAAK